MAATGARLHAMSGPAATETSREGLISSCGETFWSRRSCAQPPFWRWQILDLVTLPDECRKPTRPRAAAGPGLAIRAAELRRHLAPFHRARASTPRTEHPVTLGSETGQLLLQLGTPLTEPSVDVGAQRKQRIVHAFQIHCWHYGLQFTYWWRCDRAIQLKRKHVLVAWLLMTYLCLLDVDATEQIKSIKQTSLQSTQSKLQSLSEISCVHH